MKRINTSGRLTGQRGGNVVHRLDLRSSTRRRQSRPEKARFQRELAETDLARLEDARDQQVTDARERSVVLGDAGDSQVRHQVKLLERRLRKMALLLEQQGKEVSSGRRPEEHGVASMFREVQGLEASDAQAEHKQALMASIFRQNMKLRESVTSGSSRSR